MHGLLITPLWLDLNVVLGQVLLRNPCILCRTNHVALTEEGFRQKAFDRRGVGAGSGQATVP